MAVTSNCKENRKRSSVTVDVTDKQEYLSYSVCLLSGARNDGLVVSTDREAIVDENHERPNGCREAEWPPTEVSIDVGRTAHTMVLLFARAKKYRYRVKLHNSDGSVKAWIRDCTYEGNAAKDTKAVSIAIRVL